MIRKISIALGIAFLLLVIIASSYGLYLNIPYASKGETANALAAILGSIISAMGAAAAVYLTLSGQRHEDYSRIRSALIREVIEFSRLVVGHLTTCENIRSGPVSIPGHILTGAMALPAPVVYPAVADKIGLLSSPQNVVAFYMRLNEITYLLVPTIISDPQLRRSPLQEHNIRPLAEAFVDILVFARGIIEDSNHDKNFDEAVRRNIINDIDKEVNASRQNFKLVQ